MKDRSANIIFWMSVIMALLIAFIFWNDDWKIAAVIALLPAVFGWSVRYALTGRK